MLDEGDVVVSFGRTEKFAQVSPSFRRGIWRVKVYEVRRRQDRHKHLFFHRIREDPTDFFAESTSFDAAQETAVDMSAPLGCHVSHRSKVEDAVIYMDASEADPKAYKDLKPGIIPGSVASTSAADHPGPQPAAADATHAETPCPT